MSHLTVTMKTAHRVGGAMRGWRAALLTTMVLLGGCLGGGTPEEDVEAASVDDAGGASANAAEAAGTAGAEAGADASGTDASAATAKSVPVALEGSIPAYAQACGFTPVMGECVYAPPNEWKSTVDVTESGNVTAGSITLEWTAASPMTEELGLAFYSFDEDFEQHGFVFGPSPLTLTLDELVTLPEGWTHRISVSVGGQGQFTPAGGAFASASPQEQIFTISGELSLLTPPANP